MRSIIIALVVSLFSFVAFSQDSNKKDPFIGLQKDVVIETYGQPTKVEKNDEGGETLIYTRTRAGNGNTYDSQGHILVQTDTYTFTLDKKGKVISWDISSPKALGC